MRSLTIEGLALAIGLLLASPAFAQGALTLTLEEAIARGLAEAPRLAEAQAREAVSDAAIASRAALKRPILSASSSFVRMNHVYEFGVPQPAGNVLVIFPDIPNNYHARAEFAMPLYTAGRIDALVTAAEADRRAATDDREATAAAVAFDVTNAYWTLVMTRERASVVERALERSDANLADARARVDAGISPPNDVLSSQAQRARQNVLLIQARNDAALAELDLARLVGATSGQSIATSTPVDRATPGASDAEAQSAPALTAQATEARPERQALTERQSALRAAGEAALLATKPNISALMAVEPARPNARFVPRVDRWNTGWDLGVNVTWSIFDGGRSRADSASTVAQADVLRARTAEFDKSISLEVRQRLLDLSSTRAALVAAGEAADVATEARRVVSERLAAGVATNTELIDAEVTMLENELERTRLQAALRIGEARLLRTIGAH